MYQINSAEEHDAVYEAAWQNTMVNLIQQCPIDMWLGNKTISII